MAFVYCTLALTFYTLPFCQFINALLCIKNCNVYIYGDFQRWCYIEKCLTCNCQTSIASVCAETPPQLQSFIAHSSGSCLLIRKI